MEKMSELKFLGLTIVCVAVFKSCNVNNLILGAVIIAAIAIVFVIAFVVRKISKLHKENAELRNSVNKLTREKNNIENELNCTIEKVKQLEEKNVELKKEAMFYNSQFAKLNILSKCESHEQDEKIKNMIDNCFNSENEEEYKKHIEKEAIAKCIFCGKNIYEGEENYYCENHECNFSLKKKHEIYGEIDKEKAKKLIKGELVFFKKIKGKSGNEYAEYIKLEAFENKAELNLNSCIK